MGALVWLLIVATSIWVVADAKSIGVKTGQIEGLGNMGPWGIGCAAFCFSEPLWLDPNSINV